MDPKALPYKPNPKAPRQVLPVLPPKVRAKSWEEVALGFTEQDVAIEAQRCLQCPKPACINACPLHIDVKRFIRRLAEGDAQGAVDVISEQSPFPEGCASTSCSAKTRV
jgi:glutamate synthase (NADPH/NADH) small chain